MTKADLRLLLLAGAAVSATNVATATAQTGSTPHHTPATHSTATHSTAAHRTGTTAHAATGGCVTVPMLSTKIPALPAGTPCAKALFSVTERLDYISPLVGPEIRQAFSNLPSTTTLSFVDQTVGTGEPARPHMYYTVKYTGYLLDGSKFDSSYDHPGQEPITFPYGAHRVIPGWDFGFEGMHVGGKRRLFIPYQLAYGESGRPPSIPARSELIFDMELVSQSATPPAPKTPPTPPAGTPGQPGSLPSTPPTGSAPTTPQSARPQTVPDVKPAPPTPGAPTTPPQPPPTEKQPPQGL